MAEIEVELTGIGTRTPCLVGPRNGYIDKGLCYWRINLDGDPSVLARKDDRGDNISGHGTLADWRQFASDLAEVLDDIARTEALLADAATVEMAR